MIRAVLVDDEELALDRLERMVARQAGIEVVGIFTSPRQAIERIPDLNPDVAFLDIEMPGVNGLEATDQLLAAHENMDVVFVTGFDKYAVEAFELNALDYLLKPVSEERLQKTIGRILARRGAVVDRKEAGELRRVLCFGKFEVTNANFESLSLNWRTAKCRELFAYLVQHREISMSKDRIIETLWPGLTRERSDRIFHTTIYYLRKVLQDNLRMCTLRYAKNNQYVLAMEEVYCDVDCFQQMVTSCHAAGKDRVAGLEKAVQIYRDDYMEEDYFEWAAGERNKLLWRYLDALKQLSKHWMSVKDYSAAEVFLRKWLMKEPFDEEARCLIMEVYGRKGNHQQLIREFEAYRSLLLEELGAEPSKEVKFLLYKLLNETLD